MPGTRRQRTRSELKSSIVQARRQQDLKVIVMSATLDAAKFADFFGAGRVLHLLVRTRCLQRDLCSHSNADTAGNGHSTGKGRLYAAGPDYREGSTLWSCYICRSPWTAIRMLF